MAEKNDSGQNRSTTWKMLVYPDSAPEDWREILDSLEIKWCESPLHDKDIYDKNVYEEDVCVHKKGESKKPHWHVALEFSSLKSFKQVWEIAQSINAPRPQQSHDMGVTVRYMAHLDSPKKAQYPQEEIIGHMGFDVMKHINASNIATNRYKYIKEMMEYVKENDITEMEDLLMYASCERYEDWFVMLCDNCAYIMGEFLRSRRHRPHDEKGNPVNTSTGEIME